MKLGKVFDDILKFADKNSPVILTGIACACTVAAAIAAYKAGPKVEAAMNHHREQIEDLESKCDGDEEKFNDEKKEIIKSTAKEVVPAVLPPIIFGGLSIVCAISSNKVSARRIAALSAAYEISSRALTDYKEKIEEIVPKKAKEIQEAVANKHVEGMDIPDESHIYSTNHGDILCKDIYLDTYFRSSHDEIKRAINELSERVRSEQWVTVADLYELIGIKYDYIKPIAHDIGWHDSDLIQGNLPIVVSTAWDRTGTIPVIGLDYEVDPFFKEGGRFR